MLRLVLVLLLSLLLGAVNAQSNSVDAGLEWAKKKCVDLGFKAGTERYGNCVLQLSRDDARTGSNSPQSNIQPSPVTSNPATPPVATSEPPKAAGRPQVVPQVIARAAGAVFKDCSDCPEMVAIPAGSFEMGGNGSDEQPVHRVTLRSFLMGKTEVTQSQWRAVMGGNPSRFSNCGDSCPVEGVSWDDAKEFINRLKAKTGKVYRLPSEAEWEYACRAGGREEYCGGRSVDSVAWHYGNSGQSTHPVAGKRPNAWGLHDMSGNVWEWTDDCWNENYSGAPKDGNAWTTGNCSRRMVRGGSWGLIPRLLRSALRDWYATANRGGNIGFRVARTN